MSMDMVVGRMVWQVTSYSVDRNTKVTRFVLADDAPSAVAIAYKTGMFSYGGGCSVEPFGKMLTKDMFEFETKPGNG